MDLQRRLPQPTASSSEQQLQAAPTISDPSSTWLPDIMERFAASLTSNEVACALRLVNKATAARFSAPQHATIRLSQPVPHHAFVQRWAGPGAMRCLARRQRFILTELTACSGVIANLEVLLARDDLDLDNLDLDGGVFAAAAGAGQLGVCVWLREQGCHRNDQQALMAAARAGQQAVCEWLLAGRPEEDFLGTAASAAGGGHVGLMDRLLLGAGRPDVGTLHAASCRLLAGAAAGCDLPTLQRLHHTLLDMLPGGLPAASEPSITSAAAGSPTADWQAKVEWLEARGYARDVWACTAAAATPDMLPRLQWLRQRGYPLDYRVAASAAGAGNVAALQYVLGQGVDWRHPGGGLIGLAAHNGHMAVMEMLHARGVPIGEDEVRAAAFGSHVPAVAWLVERLDAGTVLTARVFTAAASCFSEHGLGYMDLLAWLRERGCPWDDTTFFVAAGNGSEEQLEWLAEQGCPMGEHGSSYVNAVDNGDLAMLRCLRRLDCPWSSDGSTFTHAVERVSENGVFGQGVARALRWLLDHGCPVDWDGAEAGARQPMVEIGQPRGGVEEWLRRDRQQVQEVVGWLRQERQQRG
ncbi:Ankyrin repeat domain-containing protein [Tetrabaena socialis]|uniref:Ankyrin repeat domain-containing protein n=1 Tax=Tetrabaena socialis TaxID=47790 RepID=A0A2J8A003_9CHLO|nr:Ankyrin repeat domain-containing protein [Tetrabaena socialis]|eukprot:PNH05836.1 Ankyrin repeat domain-containing protein [Tetrabaena socialis]